MHPETSRRLLELNRQFYATVAEPFNRTRYGDAQGKLQLIMHLARLAPHRTLRVLDVGCGNGRLAWMLDRLGRAIEYTGVDGEAQLLALAAENTSALAHVQAEWHVADLADPDWTSKLIPSANKDGTIGGGTIAGGMYDAVVCLATLQHLPGFDLRARVVSDLARLIRADGRVAVSAWQFLRSERLAAKQLEWREVGIDPAQVELGDALLPWHQERYAVRYVHQIDPQEMAQLARRAGLQIETTFDADGREGNLNYYAIMNRRCHHE